MRVLESARAAAEASRAGLRRLFAIQARGELAYQYRLLVGLERVGVLHAAFVGALAAREVRANEPTRSTGESFGEQMTLLIAELAFLEPIERAGGGAHRVPIRNKEEFDRALVAGMDRIPEVGAAACAVVEDVLSTWQRLSLRLDELARGIGAPGKATPAVAAAMEDARAHAALLLPRDFLAITPWRHLRHVPRYLSASLARLNKLPHHSSRDAECLRQLSPLWSAYLDTRERCERAGVRSATLEDFRWLLEELRVSLFAQELRTAVSVSVPKLERQWSELKL
ncbi:DUF3418 domain-containing protein [Leptolyngbya sp. 15MV]|nr:DUF3418 domain-containing protein [Leptolyngbya sp. 15MV]